LVACLSSPPRLRTTQGVTAVAPAPRGWRLSFTGASSLDAEAVILAIPAWVAARLLAGLGVSAARALDTVLYVPSITVSLAYRADQLPGTLEGAGFVAAPDSGSAVRACTYAWRKYPNRAPGGYALVRAFVGPVDGDPAAIAHAELAAILGIEGDPLWARAFHWPRGLPRYPRGHADRVAAVRERLAGLAPLAIAGAGFDGAGVSACVKSGREAARVILKRLGAASVRGLSRGSAFTAEAARLVYGQTPSREFTRALGAQQLFSSPYDGLHGQPQLLIDPLIGRRRAEPLDAQHRPVVPDPAVPRL